MNFLSRLFRRDARKVASQPTPVQLPVPPLPAGYRIYTTEFDETITVPQIPARVEPLTFEQAQEFSVIKRRFSKLFVLDRLLIREAASSLIRALVAQRSREDREKTVVTMLIDHSGSMRGIRILSACLAAEALWEALDQCGVATEIIGFTTCSWQGGKSRAKWIKAGRPPDPGRLCDLRYILYRSASDPRERRPQFAEALYPGILKENIDGEAILYAADRLREDNWTSRAIVVISDGAPVDDATLGHNADKGILLNHLKDVILETQARGIGLGYVTLHELAAQFGAENAASGLEPVAAGKGLFKVAARALGLDTFGSDLDPPGL